MLTIVFVFILLRSRQPHVVAIARPQDFVMPLWGECSAHEERPKHADRKCQHQKQSKHQVCETRTARRDEIDIWAWTLSVKQPKTIRMIVENQDAPYHFAARTGWQRWCDDSENSVRP